MLGKEKPPACNSIDDKKDARTGGCLLVRRLVRRAHYTGHAFSQEGFRFRTGPAFLPLRHASSLRADRVHGTDRPKSRIWWALMKDLPEEGARNGGSEIGSRLRRRQPSLAEGPADSARRRPRRPCGHTVNLLPTQRHIKPTGRQQRRQLRTSPASGPSSASSKTGSPSSRTASRTKPHTTKDLEPVCTIPIGKSRSHYLSPD